MAFFLSTNCVESFGWLLYGIAVSSQSKKTSEGGHWAEHLL